MAGARVLLRLLVALVTVCSIGSGQVIRREVQELESAGFTQLEDYPPMEEASGQMLTAGVSSSGAADAMASAQESALAAEASMEAYKKTYDDVQSLLTHAHQNDVFDDEGFEVSQASLDQHQEGLQPSLDHQLLQTQESRRDKALAYDGSDAVVTGYWAKDRPNEERIDPDNLKIYTFGSYEKRFPYTHSWDVEVMWKKLPLAPKAVHWVTREESPNTTVRSDVLLEGGAILADERGQELIWTKDSNGYYHTGRDIPTDEEVFQSAHPREAHLLKKHRREHHDQHGDYQKLLGEVKKTLSSSRREERNRAAQTLEHMLVQLEDKLQLKPSWTGKAFISVRGANGYLCSFNADVSKVTGVKAKHRIEQVTGIPWEAQKIFVNGHELHDADVLSTHVGADHGAWIDLQEIGGDVMQHALIKRGKLAAPKAAPKLEEEKILSKEIKAKLEAVNNKAVQEHARAAATEMADNGIADTDDTAAMTGQMLETTSSGIQTSDSEVRVQTVKSSETKDKAEQDDLKRRKNVAPEQHAAVTRKTVYEKYDGAWHMRTLPGSGSPGMLIESSEDAGIPVTERLSNEGTSLLQPKGKLGPKLDVKVDTKVGVASARLAHLKQKFQERHQHKGTIEAQLEAFRKEEKKALSDEMKWRNEEIKRRHGQTSQEEKAAKELKKSE